MNNIKTTSLLLSLMFILIVLLIISFMLGATNYSLQTVFDALFHYSNKETHHIIREIRIPREIAAVLVGIALSCSGAVMQAITKNPLADPALLGLNSGALLAISITLMVHPGAHFLILMLAGFIGAVGGGMIVLTIGMSNIGGFNPIRIILAGAAVSAFLTALAQGIAIAAKTNQSITLWSSGGVAGTTWQQIQIAAPIIIVLVLIITLFGRQLTVLNLGDSVATGLGINTTSLRVIFSIMTMILAGIAVAIVGSLAFVGLMIPHMARFIVGTDYRKIIPVASILGGIFILLADIVARQLGEAPVGAIVALVGVPYFIYLVRKDERIL